jgi:hypothetical protein
LAFHYGLPDPGSKACESRCCAKGRTTDSGSHSLRRKIVSVYFRSLADTGKSPFAKSVSVFSKVTDLAKFIIIVALTVVRNEIPNVNTVIAASLQANVLAVQAGDQVIVALFNDHQILVQVTQTGVE